MTQDSRLRGRDDMATLMQMLDEAYKTQDVIEGQAIIERIYAHLDREMRPHS